MTTSMRLPGKIEQPVRLDHLEAFVHQSRRIDGDLAAHPPRRMAQRIFRLDAGERRDRHLTERSARRRQDDASNLLAPPPVEALMDGVVLAVDRKDGDAARTRGRGHERACHHQHFLVGERDGFAGVDRGKDGLERVGPRRCADHDVDVRVGGDGNQPLAARCGRQRRYRGAERRRLFAQAIGIRPGGKPDDRELVRMRADHVERALPDRSRRAQNSEPFHR